MKEHSSSRLSKSSFRWYDFHICFLHYAENRDKFVEHRQIKVINYHRAFKLLYFRGYNKHCDPECLENPFRKAQYLYASLMIHAVKGFYALHLIKKFGFLCSLGQELNLYL
jgi:hypothetical protein